MSRRSFALRTSVPCTPEAALDFLADLAAHRGLHPYLESATKVGRAAEGFRTTERWRVVERPRLGRLRYRIRFTAQMSRMSPTVLLGHVVAAPGCTLDTTTIATSVAGATDGTVETELHETCIVVAPWPLVGYMTRHALAAHQRTYLLLPGEIAGRAEQ